MKKITRMFILLLTAGALFMSCNPSSGGTPGGDDSGDGSGSGGSGSTGINGMPETSFTVDTSDLSVVTEITLSDGTWQMTEAYQGSDSEVSEPSTAGRKIIYSFTVSGNSTLITSGSIVKFQTITLADDNEVARVKNNKEGEAAIQRAGGKNAQVAVNGRTLTYAVWGNLSDNEVDDANCWYKEPADFYALPSGATIMKNAAGTEYYAVCQEECYEDLVKARTYADATHVLLFEKKN